LDSGRLIWLVSRNGLSERKQGLGDFLSFYKQDKKKARKHAQQDHDESQLVALVVDQKQLLPTD
jgi:hypothetical protein